MRVLALDQYSDLGGAQQCLADLIPAWTAHGWELTVAAPGRGLLAERVSRARAAYEEIPLGHFSARRKRFREAPRFAAHTLRLALELRKKIVRLDPDVIYVNGPRLLPAVALGAAAGRRLVFHCHSAILQASAAAAARLALSSRAWLTLTCSEYSHASLAGAGVEWRLIYNGVAAGPARKANRHDDRLAFGVIGRIAPEKGQLAFVHAVRLLGEAAQGRRFLICGDVLFDDPAARDYAEEARRTAGEGVEWLGWRDDPTEVLDTLDWLVVPSLEEPATTRVILEAYARGVPVIAFASGGIPEVVADGETGRLVELRGAGALAGAIRAALQFPDAVRRRMGDAGRALWERRFRLERFQHEVTAAVEEAARG